MGFLRLLRPRSTLLESGENRRFRLLWELPWSEDFCNVNEIVALLEERVDKELRGQCWEDGLRDIAGSQTQKVRHESRRKKGMGGIGMGRDEGLECRDVEKNEEGSLGKVRYDR